MIQRDANQPIRISLYGFLIAVLTGPSQSDKAMLAQSACADNFRASKTIPSAQKQQAASRNPATPNSQDP
jgi:hypothetical protein